MLAELEKEEELAESFFHDHYEEFLKILVSKESLEFQPTLHLSLDETLELCGRSLLDGPVQIAQDVETVLQSCLEALVIKLAARPQRESEKSE